jgi:hypothetical protein
MLEINRNSEYTFRINPDDPKQVDRRENRHNARWTFWLRRDSATEAKIALLKIQRGDAGEEADT